MAVLAAEHHDHNIFGFGRQVNDPVRRDVWRFAQQLIITFMSLAPCGNFSKVQRRMLPEIILNLLLGDAVPSHDLRVFYAEADERRSASEAADIEMAHAMVHL